MVMTYSEILAGVSYAQVTTQYSYLGKPTLLKCLYIV